jgi:hypothetical protein
LVVVMAMTASTSPSAAQVEGQVSFEWRTFTAPSHAWPRAEPTATVRLRQRFSAGPHEFVVAPSFRFDPRNADRFHLDGDEIALRGTAASLDFAVGMREVFWGVLESRHLVDVVNQWDPSVRWPREEKLGQPMIALTWTPDLGNVELFVLPWARPRPFDGRRGRLWSDLPVDTEIARSAETLLGRHLGWAARWSLSGSAWDLGISYFDGSAREPRFESRTTPAGLTHLRPVYDRIRQIGLETQYTGQSLLWKAEFLAADAEPGRYVAAGSGVEYQPADYLSVFAEFLYDSRGRDAPTSLEHDLFLGTRLLYQDGSVTLGVSTDLSSGNIIGSAEVTRRLASDFIVGLELRAFAGDSADEPPFALREETSISLLIRRFF